jgi:hypothetical protein
LEKGLAPAAHYAAYHLRVHQQPADWSVLEAFQNLYDQAFVED